MASKHMRADVNYAWPSDARLPDGREGCRGNHLPPGHGEQGEDRCPHQEYEDRFLNPFVATAVAYIDDVIRPHSTRLACVRAYACSAKTGAQIWKKGTTTFRCVLIVSPVFF